ncbi:MAG: riboflavin synthase [Kiritimatiellia bacterium]
MFTGLIEQVGSLSRLETRGEGGLLTVKCAPWEKPLVLGESMAVEGVCLTVASILPDGFGCDILRETLDRTTLGAKRPGAELNLERALQAGGRLGGHFVSGHVDGVGELLSVGRAGADWVLDIGASAELIAGMVLKGSIAVNGVSLTIARLSGDDFEVHLIPHTWSNTTLHGLKTGSRINLESDMLGKYVRAFLQKNGHAGPGGLTLERMGEAGFL